MAAHRKRQLEIFLCEPEDTERLAQETSHKLAEAHEEEEKGKTGACYRKGKVR